MNLRAQPDRYVETRRRLPAWPGRLKKKPHADSDCQGHKQSDLYEAREDPEPAFHVSSILSIFFCQKLRVYASR